MEVIIISYNKKRGWLSGYNSINWFLSSLEYWEFLRLLVKLDYLCFFVNGKPYTILYKNVVIWQL